MSDLKRIAKYVLLVIGVYLLSSFLIFVGLNANYKSIQLIGELPEQITVDKAEATKKQGRIYGKVKNPVEGNLNGKYIKVLVYNEKKENIATQFLKIDNLQENEEKSYKITFNAENAKSYEINIADYD